MLASLLENPRGGPSIPGSAYPRSFSTLGLLKRLKRDILADVLARSCGAGVVGGAVMSGSGSASWRFRISAGRSRRLFRLLTVGVVAEETGTGSTGKPAATSRFVCDLDNSGSLSSWVEVSGSTGTSM